MLTSKAKEKLESGRTREREFFQMSAGSAYSIFQEISKLRGDEDSLVLVKATKEEQAEEQVAEQRRPRFSFKMLGIPVGAELHFIRDESIVCTVLNDKNVVEYEGEETTLSALATQLLNWDSEYSVQGPLYWLYEDEALSDRRTRLEVLTGQESCRKFCDN